MQLNLWCAAFQTSVTREHKCTVPSCCSVALKAHFLIALNSARLFLRHAFSDPGREGGKWDRPVCPRAAVVTCQLGLWEPSSIAKELSSSVMWGLCLEASLCWDVGLMKQLPQRLSQA